MTTQEIINYYASLLILQYVGQPKAYATIQTVVTPVVMDQLPTQVMNGYNLNGASPAVGVQLDVLGKYVGVVRSGYGVSGPITLSDADFLVLIKFAIIINNLGSSLSDIQNAIFDIFPNEILVFDYANMHMSYLVNSSIGSQDLIELAISEGLLPKPMGVQLGSVIYAPVIDAFFGGRTYLLPAHFASPLNSYTDYEMNRPWLSYQDAIQPLTILGTEDGKNLVQESGDFIYLG